VRSPDEQEDGGMVSPSSPTGAEAPDSPAPVSPQPPRAIDMAYAHRDSMPLPVSTSRASSRKKKNARIESPLEPPRQKLRVHWSRFVKRMGTATAPSSSSVIGGEESTNGDGSFYYGRARRHVSNPMQDDDEKREVDEVGEWHACSCHVCRGLMMVAVVDREWSHDVKTSIVDASEAPDHTSHHPGTTGDHESVAVDSAFWGCCTPLIVLRYRCWPAVVDFFHTQFHDLSSEGHYKKESWFLRKVWLHHRRTSESYFSRL
jgi:osomolarity two-component system sensor histidine kinase SLN1